MAGPNNTGKTYAAYTVYGVCDLMKSDYAFSDNLIGLKAQSNFSSKLVKGENNIDISEFIDDEMDSLSELINKTTSKLLNNIFTT